MDAQAAQQENETEKKSATSRVILVGAGPGAADLITRRGAQAVTDADVVVADGLTGNDLKSLAGPNTRWIDAAKRVGNPSISQDGIIDLLINEALAGNTVVRLKGGDVGLFARAGEEIAALQARGIAVDVIPGVTSASAAAASACMSLTHRDLSSAVTFLTGHTKDGLPDLSTLSGPGQTLGVYMGLSHARFFSNALVERGYLPSTAVAVVENASDENERILYGTLRTLADLIAGHAVQSPALIIIGDVVRTAQGWWRSESRPDTDDVSTQAHFAHG